MNSDKHAQYSKAYKSGANGYTRVNTVSPTIRSRSSFIVDILPTLAIALIIVIAYVVFIA